MWFGGNGGGFIFGELLVLFTAMVICISGLFRNAVCILPMQHA